jgi:uncharacterized protein YbjQ (UPF0145 family)
MPESNVSSLNEHVLSKKKVESKNWSQYDTALFEIYNGLANKLRIHAAKQKANAIVGINYQLTPLMSESEEQSKQRYKVTCSGSLVIVN